MFILMYVLLSLIFMLLITGSIVFLCGAITLNDKGFLICSVVCFFLCIIFFSILDKNYGKRKNDPKIVYATEYKVDTLYNVINNIPMDTTYVITFQEKKEEK